MQPSFPAQSPIETPQLSAQAQAAMRDNQIMQIYKAAGSNFYSIAIFSLINSVINIFQGNVQFPIGLGVAQLIDGLAFVIGRDVPGAKTTALIIGLALNLAIFGVVALFGFFIAKRVGWLIPLGGVLYLLDGILLLFFSDWIGAAFHAYFLYRIFVRWQAVRSVEKINLPPAAIGI